MTQTNISVALLLPLLLRNAWSALESPCSSGLACILHTESIVERLPANDWPLPVNLARLRYQQDEILN